MSIFRVFGVATAIISGGAALARNEIDRRIQKAVDAKIEEAKVRAIQTLDETINAFVQEQLLNFTRNIVFKAGTIAIFLGGYMAGIFSSDSTKIIISATLAVFILRDIIILYPTFKQVLKLARTHKWNLFQAIRELVAADVFDHAYEEVMQQTKDPKVKYWIALSRYSDQKISTHIAQAISNVAANASVPIVRTRAGIAIGRAALMMFAYSLTLTLALYFV